ncbi:D-alanyl-D-alanine carboxypeptidase [Pseudooceanicola sp. CBS1P-1]|uniref:serine-type D-Ala-D-Ala carboxypeptidase n=1 Tax=Pseudooceanicola albus TaxID=2692189 RepID=A0A6L7G905_9RHOB|nr:MULTISPECIES: D-alanyl-D-alanine carboxypeptidase family protein [Pseudooceanicola]MBT9385776.1 D-alanyl-D-alanine carboxypeptidase [Pseudooceanicola endophyticus]MXN20008.1 D-alanyl-D-alanine carboxypeptidase [Pseudooceanicola albus]
MLSTASRLPILALLGGLLLCGAGPLTPALAEEGGAGPVPQAALGAPQPPELAQVASYVVMDAQTGDILAEKGATLSRAPASLTKMMTAYLTYKALQHGMLSLDQTVPVSTAAWKAGGSRMFISPSSTVTVNQLLHGLIIESGNDAAIALAEAVGGTQDAFVGLMNAEAERLGLKDTHYANVSGLPDPGLHTTALDVAKLSRAIILDYPQFLQISAQKDYTFDKIHQRSWNPVLFRDPSVDGLKTGLTDAAGHCIAATAFRDGRRLITVEMGGPNWSSATDATEALLGYGYQYFDNKRVATVGAQVGVLSDARLDPESVPVGAARDLTLSLPVDGADPVTATLHLAQNLPETLPAGSEVGTISYAMGSHELASVPAVTLAGAQPAGLVTRVMRDLRARF